MANTERHIELVGALCTQGNIIKTKEGSSVKIYQESAALVHYGSRTSCTDELSLVDISTLDNDKILSNLNYVQPDFMVFQKNSYIWNKQRTRIAGFPDLIVEIWSESDSGMDKGLKFSIYSNSQGKTEHWYISQDTNVVECYLGKNRLEDKNLSEPLITLNMLKFDLSHLAL
jgi:hypothetical protein